MAAFPGRVSGARGVQAAGSVAFALALAGCVTWHPATVAPQAVECRDRPHCDRVWSALQVWLVNNCRMRIQTATDAVIQTFRPGDSNTLGYTATRTLRADGGGSIAVRAVCEATVYGCIANPETATTNLAASLRLVN